MRVRDEEGVTLEQHLRVRARQGGLTNKGRLDAEAALQGPPFPEALRYLHDWLYEVHGRSGADLGGLSPLTYTTLAHWAMLTDQHPAPHEIDALLVLDMVLRSPDAGEEAD